MDSATALAGHYLSPIADTPLTSILPNFHSISKTPPRGHFAYGKKEGRCSETMYYYTHIKSLSLVTFEIDNVYGSRSRWERRWLSIVYVKH